MALYNSNLYPLFGVSSLRSQRGQRWADLVDRVSKLPGSDPHVMAFTLTMRRLNRQYRLEHTTCADPFCAVCAAQIVARFDGSEQELLDMYYRNLNDIQNSLKTMRVRTLVVEKVGLVA